GHALRSAEAHPPQGGAARKRHVAMGVRRSDTFKAEMEAMRAEIKVIEEMEEPTEEDLARAEALLSEWDGKKTLFDQAVDRERKTDEVLRAALDNGHTETGDGPVRRGPEVKRSVDPFEDNPEFRELMRSAKRAEVVNFDADATISRAKYAVDGVPRW